MRIELGLRAVAASAAVLVGTGDAAMSQVVSQQGPGRMNDIADTLHSGTVVRIRNMVVFRGQNGNALTVYIQTPTPATQPERLASEAKEIAGARLKGPMIGNLTSVSVAVCRTTDCLGMREKPEEMFSFIRASDGSLEAEKLPGAIVPQRRSAPGSAPHSMAAVSPDSPLMRITSFLVGEWREPVCGSEPSQGEFTWFAGGDYCAWLTPTRGRIVAQRDQQHRVHAVLLTRQTNGEANARLILDSLATTLRSLGLSGRECAPGSVPAGGVRSWLYKDRTDLLVNIQEITPPAGPPRLVGVAVDIPNAFPPALCH